MLIESAQAHWCAANPAHLVVRADATFVNGHRAQPHDRTIA